MIDANKQQVVRGVMDDLHAASLVLEMGQARVGEPAVFTAMMAEGREKVQRAIVTLLGLEELSGAPMPRRGDNRPTWGQLDNATSETAFWWRGIVARLLGLRHETELTQPILDRLDTLPWGAGPGAWVVKSPSGAVNWDTVGLSAEDAKSAICLKGEDWDVLHRAGWRCIPVLAVDPEPAR